MTEAFNNFLGDLTTELNKFGGHVKNVSLKNRKIVVRLQTGRDLVIGKLPKINDNLLFYATKALNVKKLAEMARQVSARADGGGSAVPIFAIIAILVLVLAVLYFILNPFFKVTSQTPPTQ
jgi:hypothetical protein